MMIDARATLLLAPVGAGKTEAALDRLTAALAARPFARIWTLLATDRQIHAFRQRMVTRSGAPSAIFNVAFFNFYTLYAHLLERAGVPQRCLDEAARFRLLRAIIEQQARDGLLELFGEIATTRGFVRVVGRFIDELKTNGITPEEFAARANAPKDFELAQIYHAYQSTLIEHALVDREGQGWLALDVLARQPQLAADVDLVLVDGYDQFTTVQARLLDRLAAQSDAMFMTLTTAPGRERTIGRRFERARQRLREAFGSSLHEVHAEARSDARPAPLQALTGSLFRHGALPTDAGASVVLIEAPDVAAESAALLRRVKLLLLDGCPPDDILIAVRDWAAYAPQLAAAARGYGLLPLLALQSSEALAENPAITALLNLLDLPLSDFRRRDLLDVLRSPYFEVPGLSGAWVDLLERLSRLQRVTAGRAAWLDAIRLAARTPADADEDGESASPLTAEDADYLERHLTDFFDRLAAPPDGSVAFHVKWLETLIGPDPEDDEGAMAADTAHVQMIACLRRPALQGVVERDLSALAEFKRQLRALVSMEGLFSSLNLDTRLSWSAFLVDLKAIVRGASAERSPSRAGRVLVTSVTDARGLPHRHVFIPGLSEGTFPARPGEDPLYLDSERRSFAELGVPLQTSAERADDDGLFYELISLPRATLTLSRSTVEDGAPLPASHLWRAVTDLFADSAEIIRAHRVALGAVVDPARVASLTEAALAAADGLSRQLVKAELDPLVSWLMADDSRREFWGRVERGRLIEVRRLSRREPHDRYSGRLKDADMIAYVAEAMSPAQTWSASRLNDYGICGFRYFAGHVLRLEPMRDPEDGMDALQMGTLFHEILEQTYRKIGDNHLAIAPENTEIALGLLREIAARICAQAPDKLGFRASALWDQEQTVLLRRLETLVREDFGDAGPLKDEPARLPYRLEYFFGGPNNPLTIDLGGGERLRVRGKIDRIDRSGDQAVVVDYKTGSAKIDLAELKRGRNFQMMLYVLAAEQLLAGDGLSVSRGIFWHIGGTGRAALLGELRPDDAEIEDARAHLSRYLRRGRAGDFSVHANKLEEGRCARYCDFHHLCRMSSVHRGKPDA